MKYDVTVIGSGPGGYVAAIRCAQLGLKTAIIEKYATLGGTCLNVGCIPSKALLDSSEHYHAAQKKFQEHGIDLKDLKVNMPQMIKRKREVVEQTCKGIEFLMKKNKIDVFTGVGSFASRHSIKITNEQEEKTIETDKVIIATGSKPNLPPAFNFDGERIISSTEALELQEVPGKMVVIGGGVIGMELGSVYGRLGTEIHVVEYMDSLIAGMDKDLGRELMKVLKKQLGFTFHFKHGVQSVERKGDKVIVKAEARKDGKALEIEADYCLVAIGRRAYTDGLGLENIHLSTDDRGRVEVNEHLETSIEGVYAIGDVVRGAMLAHKAEEEGVFVAETIAGQKPHINYKLIPGVVYTWPEVAGVGFTEQELKDEGTAYKAGKFPFRALGRARASGDVDGFVKILSHKDTDEVLGVHIIGARAADLIAEAVTAMEYRASAEDIARMSHSHPTYAEATKEAALAASADRALHI